MAWSDTFLKVLKDNDVRLVTYVPDNVLTPLLNGFTSDNYFRSFALIANAPASLNVPSQIPTVSW